MSAPTVSPTVSQVKANLPTTAGDRGTSASGNDSTVRLPSRRGDLTWEIAELFPCQGEWTEEDYLALDTNRLIEFKDGVLEFLPVTHKFHQLLVRFLFRCLDRHVVTNALGEVLFAPLRVRLRTDLYREPDVVFLSHARLGGDPKKIQVGADLVMEVVSDGTENRARDLVEKRADYAEAGVAEYWIVDPEQELITVLSLSDGAYRVHGEFRSGDVATSILLTGFEVDVAACFNAA